MRDTTPELDRLVTERYRAMSGVERVRIAAGMFDTARTLALADLDPAAGARERRVRLLERFYPELSDALRDSLG
jgi:hypothetical protein